MILWLFFFCTRFWSNILLLLRTRLGNGFAPLQSKVRNDSCKMILLSSSARSLKLIFTYWYFYPFSHEVRSWSWFIDTSILFRTRFKADLDLLILLSSSVRGFDFLSKNDTSILFHSRFEADFDLLKFLSSFARGLKLTLICWYFYPLSHEVRSWPLFIDTSILFRMRFETNL